MQSVAAKLITDIEQAKESFTRLTTEYEILQKEGALSALDMDLMMLHQDLTMAMRSARKIFSTIGETVPSRTVSR
jgi:fumarate hydratase class II